MKILILDDDPFRHDYFRETLGHHAVVHTSTYQSAVAMLGVMSPFDVAYLDRDLNDWGAASRDEDGQELSGEDVVTFIVRELPEDLRPRRVVVHSHHRRGAQRMYEALVAAGIPTALDPFPFITCRQHRV